MKNNYKKQLVLKSSLGFTIIEVMVSVTVISIGMMGAISLINYNISIASNSVNRTMAANLAEDGIEMARNVRDTNWMQGNLWDLNIEGEAAINSEYIKFFCGDGTIASIAPAPSGGAEKDTIDNCGANCQIYAYSSGNIKCFGDNYGGNYNGYAGAPLQANGSLFYRLVHIRRIDDDSNALNVTIKWMDRNGQYRYLTVGEILYNWK